MKCKKCGSPMKWVRIGGRWHGHNPDGTDHWDTCSKLRWQQTVATGERYDTKEEAGYLDSIHGSKRERISKYTTVGKHYNPVECDCGTPPWEYCKHSRKENRMAQPKYPNISVQLTGKDGNAFFIIGRVSMALKRNGVETADIDAFKEDAMSGDYDHVLQTAMKWVDVS